MPEIISIATSGHVELLKSRLNAGSGFLAGGLKIDCAEEKHGNFTFFGCRLDIFPASAEGKKQGETFRYYLADVVADVIINRWERELIREIIRNNFGYFNEEEQEQILCLAEKALNNFEENRGAILFYRLKRKKQVMERLQEYLLQNNHLVIEGFIRFRLKDYLQELQQAVEKAVDEYLLEWEYKEFIRLLRYFVDLQRPRVAQVHVILKNSGYFKIMDGEKRNLSCEELEGFVFDVEDSDIDQGDLLISALVTVAPERVFLHYRESPKTGHIVETLANIFGPRLHRCQGCEYCRSMLQVNH